MSHPYQDSTGAWGSPAPASGPGGWSPVVAPPPKRRGLVRIIVGSVLLLLGLLGLLLGAILGAVIGAMISLVSLSGDDAQVVQPGQSVRLSDGIYMVSSSTAGAACTATATPAGSVEVSEESLDQTIDKDGATFHVVQQLTVNGAPDVTVACNDGGPAAMVRVGYGGIVVGTVIGFGIPALVALLGLILLISGIIGRVRSGRAPSWDGVR